MLEGPNTAEVFLTAHLSHFLITVLEIVSLRVGKCFL